MRRTDASRTVSTSITSTMQQKDSLHNIKSCSASTAAIMAIEQAAVSENQDAANAAKSITPENAKARPLQLTAFNAKDLMKPGTPSAQRESQRKNDWKN